MTKWTTLFPFLFLALLLPSKLSAGSGNVTAHRSIQDGVDVPAAGQRHLHDLVQVVKVELLADNANLYRHYRKLLLLWVLMDYLWKLIQILQRL